MVPVILAGGSGSRLWPLGRQGPPKQFAPLVGGRSLFRMTCDRLAGLGRPGDVLAIVGSGQSRWARRAAPTLRPRNIIEEEVGRNTAASVALAALAIRARHGDAVMVVLPADHLVSSVARWRATVRRAVAAVRSTRLILAIGVPARRGEPGFGYLRPGRMAYGRRIHKAAGFVEKPRLPVAARMARSGRWLWNSGMFVWTVDAILAELEAARPDIVRPIAAWARRRRWPRRIPARLLRRIPVESIDRAVLERTRRLIVARGDFGWSDLGSWTDVIETLGSRQGSHRALGPILSVEARRCLGASDAGPIAFVGVKDIAVARFGDAVLVCGRHRTQKVREVASLDRSRRRR